MISKHKNPEQRGRIACAPYNFIPLPEQIIPAEFPLPDHDIYYSDRHTGYIECTLTTKSPTYTRCAVDPEFFRQWVDIAFNFNELTEAQKNEFARFFSIDDADHPVIPGSSLRGMVRTLVEIAGYGKMQWVTDKQKVFFRAVAAAKDDPLAEPYRQILGKFGRNVRAGYLVKHGNEWHVKPAKCPFDLGWPDKNAFLKIKEKDIPAGLPNLVRFNEPNYKPQYHPVSFEVVIRKGFKEKFVSINKIGPIDANYKYKGVLVCSGNMLETAGSDQVSPRRAHTLVLEPNERAKLLKINPQAVLDYTDSLTDFQKEQPFEVHMGCLIQDRPIFYVEPDENEDIFFFGHSPNFRIPALFHKEKRAATPHDLLPDVHLGSESTIDLAEAIFGYTKSNKVLEGKERSYASRVFFTDAHFVSAQGDADLSEQSITPKILASPKPTCFQHYLTQQMPDDRKMLNHYASPPPHETIIRGHKLYWHKGNVPLDDLRESNKAEIIRSPKQYTRIKPVKADVTFNFCIYFENLSQVELGVLLWALSLPGEPGKEYCHSIGMGKPLGMGAVKIIPELYISNRHDRYCRLFDGECWAEAVSRVSEFQPYIKAFEQYILGKLSAQEKRQAKRFHEVERIKMLLKILEWPGPDRAITRYLQIEPNNEYRGRPVLPDPLSIQPPSINIQPSRKQDRRRGAGQYSQQRSKR